MDIKKPYIIAHRGASALVKFENTIEAFQKAIDIGAPIMEFDVRRTKDNVMISYHDEKIDGTKISDLTYEQLQNIANNKGFSVPTVEEILKLSKDKIILDIELKETDYEEELVNLVKQYLDYNQYFMKSFIDEAVKRVKEIDEKICTGLLIGVINPVHKIRTRVSEIFPIVRILRINADFVSPSYRLLKFGFLKRMKIFKIPVYAWTINDITLIKKLIDMGVDGIITDYPDRALELLKKNN